MGLYSVYLLDQVEHLHGIVSIKFAADAEALEYAHRLVGIHGRVELWARGQCPDISVSDDQNPSFVPTAAVVRRLDDRQLDVDLLEVCWEAG